MISNIVMDLFSFQNVTVAQVFDLKKMYTLSEALFHMFIQIVPFNVCGGLQEYETNILKLCESLDT